jgi:GNAT superfamily N-acetyltransferase
MTLAAAQAPAVVHATMARQPNHHHHHHHVSSKTPSSATPKGLFDLSQLVADGYVGYGGSYVVPSAASHNNNVRSTAQLLPPAAITTLRLTGREDFTRVQLQKQRVGEQQYSASIVGDRIPGFKTSAGKFSWTSLFILICEFGECLLVLVDPIDTCNWPTSTYTPYRCSEATKLTSTRQSSAFFASLRTNLRLHASPPSSPMSTPSSMRGSMTSLPPPSPLSGPSEISEPAAPEDPLADIPELHSYMARDEADKTAALKLVADSVAQMRQTANSALIFHPLNLALAVGLMAFVARWLYDRDHDWSLVGTSCAGVLMALLAGYRWCTQDYLHTAESINWDWVEGSDIIVTKFGEEIIGTVIVDWISGESSRQKRKKAWRGEIRAWTVRLRYRGKGVGAALLEDAVKEARKKSAESLEFAEDHASEFLLRLITVL